MHCFPIILYIFSLFYSFRSTFPWSIWQDGGALFVSSNFAASHAFALLLFIFGCFFFFFTYLSQLVPVLGPFPTSLLEESGSLNRHSQTKTTIVYHGTETPFVQVLPTYKVLPSTHQSPPPLQNKWANKHQDSIKYLFLHHNNHHTASNTIPFSHLQPSSQPARPRLEKSLGLTASFSLVQVGEWKDRKLRIVPGFQLGKKKNSHSHRYWSFLRRDKISGQLAS